MFVLKLPRACGSDTSLSIALTLACVKVLFCFVGVCCQANEEYGRNIEFNELGVCDSGKEICKLFWLSFCYDVV